MPVSCLGEKEDVHACVATQEQKLALVVVPIGLAQVARGGTLPGGSGGLQPTGSAGGVKEEEGVRVGTWLDVDVHRSSTLACSLKYRQAGAISPFLATHERKLILRARDALTLLKLSWFGSIGHNPNPICQLQGKDNATSEQALPYLEEASRMQHMRHWHSYASTEMLVRIVPSVPGWQSRLQQSRSKCLASQA